MTKILFQNKAGAPHVFIPLLSSRSLTEPTLLSMW